MAIAFDAVSTGQVAFDSTLTFAHTCTGADRLLVVSIACSGAQDVTGVTYATIAMTRVGSAVDALGARSTQYRLIAPATGANNIVVTITGNDSIAAGGTSFTGVHQTTPLGTAATATGSSTAPSVVVTSATDEVVVDGLCALTNPTATVGADQTQRWNILEGVALRGAGSTELGAASVTMSWTLSPSSDWALIGVSIKPAGAAAAAPRGHGALLMDSRNRTVQETP